MHIFWNNISLFLIYLKLVLPISLRDSRLRPHGRPLSELPSSGLVILGYLIQIVRLLKLIDLPRATAFFQLSGLSSFYSFFSEQPLLTSSFFQPRLDIFRSFFLLPACHGNPGSSPVALQTRLSLRLTRLIRKSYSKVMTYVGGPRSSRKRLLMATVQLVAHVRD